MKTPINRVLRYTGAKVFPQITNFIFKCVNCTRICCVPRLTEPFSFPQEAQIGVLLYHNINVIDPLYEEFMVFVNSLVPGQSE